MAGKIHAEKTEHAGAKHGQGAYWGPKAVAKQRSKKRRRLAGRGEAAEGLGERERDGSKT